MAHLLVAEDDPNIRTLLDMILSLDAHQISFANDGQEALRYLKEHTPDLIILDVNMPYISGIDICARIRLIDRFDNTPIVILTAMDDLQTLTSIRDAGADLYLSKPLSGLDLRTSINELINHRSQPEH